MLRPQMRDEIRRHAEIAGATEDIGLINNVIQEVLDDLTGLAKYDELYQVDQILAIAANGLVTFPSAMQHFDDRQVYFLVDGSVDIGNKYLLHPFTRSRVTSFGPASQFRLIGTIGTPVVLKMQVTPYDDISTADDRVMVNYWAKLTWNLDDTTFPFPKMQEALILKVASRICRKDNSRLAAKLAAEGRDAYVALRAQSTPR
jgi:hypothetical protein